MSALAHDVDLGALVLQITGKKLRARGVNVETRVTDATVDRTMDGASTLELVLDDHARDLLRSGVLDRQVDVEVDGLWWRMVKVSKQGDTLTLTFEDRAVSLLRQNTKPRKAARSAMTRAEFARSLVAEVKPPIPFVCPDLHVKQKIAKSSEKVTKAARKKTVSQGLASGTKLTVKGSPASSQQKANGQRALDVANSLGASGRAAVALIEACIVESTITNPSSESADGYGSTGILQVRHVTAAPMHIDPLDIEQCCNAFLTKGFTGRGGAITLAAKNPSWTPGQVAQACQGSAYPTRYDQWQAEAEKWVAAYAGGGGVGSYDMTTTTKQLPFQFQRGGTDGTKEDSWTCLQRLAQEVGWRCYASDGSIYFVAETTLVQAKPDAILSEDTIGVSQIDFDVDNGKVTSEANVTARASRWGLPPGSVIVLENCGPGIGRWLVNDVRRSLFDAEASLQLKRATIPLPEPAPATKTVTTGGGAGAVGTGAADLGTGVPESVQRAYIAANAMTAKKYYYVWGGGHAHVGKADYGTGRDMYHGPGFDCSGSTCAILAAGGMGYKQGGAADVSGSMAASWGDAGEGQYLTVWANAVHVWMEFKVGKQFQHFGTGNWGSLTGTGGASWQRRMHTKDGFTPRHWPGT